MVQNIKVLVLLSLMFVTAVNFFTYLRFRDATKEAKLQFVYSIPAEDIFNTRVAYVAGAVKSPGVYNIERDTRVVDLIDMAGGLVKDADLNKVNTQLNLAKIVEDEERVVIPFEEIPAERVSGTGTGSNTELPKVNLNTASRSELESLKGIGPSTADKIIAARPYAKIDDLLKVAGIGNVTLDNIREQVEL